MLLIMCSLRLNRGAQTLNHVGVNLDFAFGLQAVFKSRPERVIGCALLGLEQLLTDLVGLEDQFLGICGVMRDNAVHEPASGELLRARWSARRAC